LDIDGPKSTFLFGSTHWLPGGKTGPSSAYVSFVPQALFSESINLMDHYRWNDNTAHIISGQGIKHRIHQDESTLIREEFTHSREPFFHFGNERGELLNCWSGGTKGKTNL